MSFFIKPKKRHGNQTGGSKTRTKKFGDPTPPKRSKKEDEEILSDDEEEAELQASESATKKRRITGSEESSESEDNLDAADEDHEEIPQDETPQERELRLARKYLEKVRLEEREKRGLDDDAQLDDKIISNRIGKDLLDQEGLLVTPIAQRITGFGSTQEEGLLLKKNGHRLPVTCVCVSQDGRWLFSASKDCTIIKWSLENQCRKVKTISEVELEKKVKGKKAAKEQLGIKSSKGHSDHILALALSTDFKYLVSGCKRSVINVWNPDTMEHIQCLSGHRDSITGLVFKPRSHTLFSASSDRTVKVWNLDEMAFVETLLGHTDSITSLDAAPGKQERALTGGGRDNTVRIWKIQEESQLIFNGPTSPIAGSIDCVKFIDGSHFVSCGDTGAIHLWNANKKRSLYIADEAHGRHCDSGLPRWISAITALPNTDLIASGEYNYFCQTS